MNWDSLLSTKKLSEEEMEPEVFLQYPINEFEKDYHKIVSSAAFRRLQDKTQVFPLDKSDFIRTRLTHSIEVSTIARQLGIMISNNTTEYKPSDIDNQTAEKIASVLLCAGLLHDLGNPPFGHFGETVIGDWFKGALNTIQYKEQPLSSWLSPQMQEDLKHFEGNAQALRILLKAHHRSEVNLSFAIISTLVKYPTTSLMFQPEDENIKKHKPGYFLAEQEEFERICQEVGTMGDGGITRHPLTFMLEAADDIAYATADLEDAYKKGLFTLDEFVKYFQDALDQVEDKKYASPKRYSQLIIDDLCTRRKTQKDDDAFKDWLRYVRRWLMYVVVYRFSFKYKSIMEGTYQQDLFEGTFHALTINILKGAMGKFAFMTPRILKLELSAQTILSFLLQHFVTAVLYMDYQEKDKGFVPTKADKKYIAILSDNYRRDYQQSKTGDEGFDLYLRLLMVTDYISGMTDSYARTLYRELTGIE